jgi:hypothetical protein
MAVYEDRGDEKSKSREGMLNSHGGSLFVLAV